MAQILIDYYRAIEERSRKMVDAAQSENWECVMQHEGACAVLIEQLRQMARTEVLQPLERSEKTRIMQRILANDAQIRLLTEPWIEHFEKNYQRPMRLH